MLVLRSATKSMAVMGHLSSPDSQMFDDVGLFAWRLPIDAVDGSPLQPICLFEV